MTESSYGHETGSKVKKKYKYLICQSRLEELQCDRYEKDDRRVAGKEEEERGPCERAQPE